MHERPGVAQEIAPSRALPREASYVIRATSWGKTTAPDDDAMYGNHDLDAAVTRSLELLSKKTASGSVSPNFRKFLLEK